MSARTEKPRASEASIDREVKAETGSGLKIKKLVTPGCSSFGSNELITVKVLETQAGELPLIPEWTLSYTGTPGSGHAVLPAYIVTEDLIEYHWLGSERPRVFQLGVAGSLASQYAVVKFGAVVVKNVKFAHRQVLVDR